MEEELCITYYEGGKEKWQPHEVSFGIYYNYYPECLKFDFTSIYGYGSNKEEAFEEFKENFFNRLDQLNDFARKLRNNEVDIINVDCNKRKVE